jgi:hypothetical protein
MGCLPKLFVALAMLAGLFTAADFLARGLAEAEVEQRLQRAEQVSGPTDVQINGFPFLLQLARKEFANVDISGGQVGEGQVRLTRFAANLRGVRPEPDGSSAQVEVLGGSAFLSFEDLQRAVNRPGVTLASTGGNQLRVTGTVDVLGRSVLASADSKISVVDGNQLRIAATEIDVPGLPSNSDAARAVADRLNFTVPIRGLPPGLRLVAVLVTAEGITAQVQGQDVLLQS